MQPNPELPHESEVLPQSATTEITKVVATEDSDSGSDLDIDMDNLPPELREALFPTEAEAMGYQVNDDDHDMTDSSIDTDSSDEEFGSLYLTGDLTKDRQNMLALMGDSDDEDSLAARGGIKSKNEISPEEVVLDSIAPIVDLTKISIAGVVLSVVDNTFVVQASVQGSALDLYNPLFDSQGIPVGRIEDVFGNVNEPFYVVRPAPIATSTDVSPATLSTTDITLSEPTSLAPVTPPVAVVEGQSVFYILDSRFVLPSQIYVPGCDASNPNDEAADDDEIEFSDDEKETEHKRMLKAKRTAAKAATASSTTTSTSFDAIPSSTGALVPATNSKGRSRNNNRGRGNNNVNNTNYNDGLNSNQRHNRNNYQQNTPTYGNGNGSGSILGAPPGFGVFNNQSTQPFGQPQQYVVPTWLGGQPQQSLAPGFVSQQQQPNNSNAKFNQPQ